ncbi:MAG: PAS domain S-box protein [Magnetococcales bacterium]|nr:PAS domain S-box protein [Magnetococcales bacterium]
MGVFETNAAGACVYVNDQWLAIAGMNRDEAMGNGWAKALHPDDRERIFQEWENSVLQQRPFEMEYRFQRPSGGTSHVLGMARALHGQAGDVTGFAGSVIDITERKLAVAELAHYQARLEKLVEKRTREKEAATRSLNRRNALFSSFVATLPDGFCTTDGNGRILEVNDHYCRLSGYSRPELLAMRIQDVESTESPEEVAAHIAYVKQHGLDRFQTRHRAKSGVIIPMEVSVAYIREHQQFVAFLRDMRPWEQVIAELRQALVQAETASKAKGEFLTVMSHELRTPMNVVIGMGDLLLETDLDEVQRGYVNKLQNAGHNLLELINQILDLSKVEADRMQLVEQSVSLRDIFKELIDLLSVVARNKGLELNGRVDETVPPWILTDPLRLKQVLFNLVGNAIKFTEHGDVAVTATVMPGRPAMLHIAVRDTGIGIAPHETETIFEAFTQSDASLTRRHGGTGLGLALCRSLVALMGGRIHVESMIGAGSTFQIFLPITEAVPPVPTDDRDGAQHGADSPLRILLAEDVEENQMLMRAYLRETPYRLTIVNHGAEAVAMVRSEPFDLAFMDVQMPVMDGYTATRAIRQWERETGRQPLPIIALTAHALEGEAERSKEAGCDLFLSKPIKKQRLLEVIRHIQQEFSPNDAPATAPNAPPAPTATVATSG